jgi:hypothetical protein
MSRKVIRSCEMSDRPETPQEQSEEAKALRRKQLDEALSHQNKIELDLDRELLLKLRSMP